MTDHAQAVQLAYQCLLFLVDADVSRQVAEEALDHAPKLKAGMSFAVRNAVLDRFEPEFVPVPGLDFLPDPAGCLEGCDVEFRVVDCPVHGVKEFAKAAATAWGEWPK